MLKANDMLTLPAAPKTPIVFERRVDEGHYEDGKLIATRQVHYTVKGLSNGSYMSTRDEKLIGHFSTLSGAKAEISNQVLYHGWRDLKYKVEQDFK